MRWFERGPGCPTLIFLAHPPTPGYNTIWWLVYGGRWCHRVAWVAGYVYGLLWVGDCVVQGWFWWLIWLVQPCTQAVLWHRVVHFVQHFSQLYSSLHAGIIDYLWCQYIYIYIYVYVLKYIVTLYLLLWVVIGRYFEGGYYLLSRRYDG